MRRSGPAVASLRIVKRSIEIYVAQIVTLVLLLAEVSYIATRQVSALDHANLAILLENLPSLPRWHSCVGASFQAIWRILQARALRPLVQCGEYSLVIYCVGVLLSFSGHVVLSLGWNSLVSQTFVSIAGLTIMSVIASLIAGIDRTARARYSCSAAPAGNLRALTPVKLAVAAKTNQKSDS